MTSQKTMKALTEERKGDLLDQSRKALQKIREEFIKFERTMEELHFLQQIAEDLRNYRKMIKLKRYD